MSAAALAAPALVDDTPTGHCHHCDDDCRSQAQPCTVHWCRPHAWAGRCPLCWEGARIADALTALAAHAPAADPGLRHVYEQAAGIARGTAPAPAHH